MTLVKNMLAGDENCSVIFTLSDSIMDHAKKVAVVGDFNDWDAKKNCMKKTKNGKFSCTVVLQRGREYQYRYLLDGKRWETDFEADGVIPALYDETYNSLLKL